MAKTYNSIPTVTTGDVYTATAHNNIAENVNNYRVPPSCRVYRTSDQTGYTIGTQITWTNEDHDTDSMFDAGTPTRITINTAGIYLITFRYYVTATATITLAQPDITKNGSATTVFTHAPYNGTTIYGVTSTVVPLVATDYIGADLYINGGSAYVVKGNAADGFSQTMLHATWIGQVS